MSYLEIGMLACFAASWPVSIAKTLRSRTVEGKSVIFLYIIVLGYAFGIAHKLTHDYDWVTWLYAFNAGLVAVDAALWHRFHTPVKASPRRVWLRRRLVAAASVAGGGLLLSILAVPVLHLLLPGSFVFAALTNFRLQFGVLSALAALLLLLARRHAFALFACLPALWWLGGVLAYSLPATPPAAATAPALKILYANVNTANRDHGRLLRLIGETQPDLVGLLELDSNWREALAGLADSYPHQLAEYRPDNFGLALYSRLPLAGDMLRSPVIDLGTVRANFTWQNQAVTIFLTHPLPPSSDRQLRLRDAQLRWLADAAAAAPQPVIVVGDLNATDGTGIFHEFMQRSGLKDSRQGFGWQPTWPEPVGEARNLPLAPLWPLFLRIPLDHVLVSTGWTVISREIGPPIGSDHRPVLVTLALIRHSRERGNPE